MKRKKEERVVYCRYCFLLFSFFSVLKKSLLFIHSVIHSCFVFFNYIYHFQVNSLIQRTHKLPVGAVFKKSSFLLGNFNFAFGEELKITQLKCHLLFTATSGRKTFPIDSDDIRRILTYVWIF